MRTILVRIGEREFRLTGDGAGALRPEGSGEAAGIVMVEPHVFSVLLNGQSHRIVAAREGEECRVLLDGLQQTAIVETRRRRLLKEHAGIAGPVQQRMEIHAPMPALVVRVHVKKGDAVEAGQPLFVLEAMKMENEIRAHGPGRVERVLVAEGRAVEKGELLLVFGPGDGEKDG